MSTLEDRKKEMHRLVEEMSNPRKGVHETYKDKMKQILLIYAGHLIWYMSEKKGDVREADIVNMTTEFVEKSFKKGE